MNRLSLMAVCLVGLGTLHPNCLGASFTGLYKFDEAGAAVPNSVSPTGLPILPQLNGSGFASANEFGVSAIGTRLGNAGRVVEPVSGTNNFAFWLAKGAVAYTSDWSVLMWVQRNSNSNIDTLFYVGVSDGFSGASAETSVFVDESNRLRASNYTGSADTSIDMDINVPGFSSGEWHQIGLVRRASSFELFVDGTLVGADSLTTLNSFGVTANSYVVFGGVKSVSNAAHRSRMLNGLIDQIEVYQGALSTDEVFDRYEAIAVPEPATNILLVAGISVLCLFAFAKAGYVRRGVH